MRLLLLVAAGAGLASAQCYVFSGSGITYSMNVSGITSVANVLDSTEFIVQQASTLTYGGKTYTVSGPGNVSIESDGGESTFQSAVLQLLTSPPWQVGVFLVGNVTLQLGSLPASLPPVSSWQVQTPFLWVSINGILPETEFTITSIGSCGSGEEVEREHPSGSSSAIHRLSPAIAAATIPSASQPETCLRKSPTIEPRV